MFNFVIIFCLTLTFISASIPTDWKQLAPGLDIVNIPVKSISVTGDSQITIIRINPYQWELVFIGRSMTDDIFGKTAHEWCEKYKLTAAINAGMFQIDNMTHVGYLKFKDHINSSQENSYQSVLAFNPKNESQYPPFHIFDLDETGVSLNTILRDYNSAVQNLRLIKRAGINVWNQQGRKWSEVAIGEDNKGNILFIFSRSPFSMFDLNRKLLESGIGIVAAQHLEGGPEAQVYLKINEFEVELFGSFETDYNENDSILYPWSIPNILGIRPK